MFYLFHSSLRKSEVIAEIAIPTITGVFLNLASK
jgi:hypothetical protein